MSEIKKTNLFLQSALEQIPRLLGQLNRNPSSRTFGSFDRAFWHYRTNDISCCRYQEAVYTLALLYYHQFEGNIYHQDSRVLGWIRTALRFTTNIQKGDGSFDEWYINEHSFVGTAFLTAALCQTIFVLDEARVDLPERSLIVESIRRAAEWLEGMRETTALNQEAGAIFALAAAGKLLGDSRLSEAAKRRAGEFVKSQDSEGWWGEYGGPDIGYLSLTVNYLQKYQDLTGDTRVAPAVSKAQEFVQMFIHPDGTAGGEYMSRNTEYIIPSRALPYLGAVGPANLDDRYLCYILYNWIEVGLECNGPLPAKTSLEGKLFPSAGVAVYVRPKLTLFLNLRKGGAFRLYSGGRVYYDTGVEIEGFSSGILDPENKVTFSPNPEVEGFFKTIQEPLQRTFVTIGFKTFQLLLGKFFNLKRFLRRKMINYRAGSGYRFKRSFEISEGRVIIIDTIFAAVDPELIRVGSKSAYTAVPSSKYAAVPELAGRLLSPVFEKACEGDACIVKRTFSFND